MKQYVEEPGSRAAQMLLRRHRIVSSALACVELTSALTRRRAAQQISAPQWVRTLRNVGIDRAHWELLAVAEAVIARAEEVIRTTQLRSLDALHVASAQLCATLFGKPIPFVTADVRQRTAATIAGLEVVWVE